MHAIIATAKKGLSGRVLLLDESRLPLGVPLLLLHRPPETVEQQIGVLGDLPGHVIGCVENLILVDAGCPRDCSPPTCGAHVEGDVIVDVGSVLGIEVRGLISAGLLGFSIEFPTEWARPSAAHEHDAAFEWLAAVAAVPLPDQKDCYVMGADIFWPEQHRENDPVELLLDFTLPEAERRGLECSGVRAWTSRIP